MGNKNPGRMVKSKSTVKSLKAIKKRKDVG